MAGSIGVVQHVSDDQRRARLGARHALATPAGTVAAAVDRMTCLHATEPASVYLAAFARTGASVTAIDRALYEERTVVKQLAMRGTLFAFPRELLPAVWGSASKRVAGQLSVRLAREVVANGLAENGPAWVARQFDAVLECLRAEGPTTTAALRSLLPELGQKLEVARGKAQSLLGQ